jgi:hypothetical protein
MNRFFAIVAAVALVFAVATTGYSQAAAPAAQGQRGAAPAQQGQGQGQRGQAAAVPSPPTPRWPDGKPIMGSIPALGKSGRWGAGVTTLPQGQGKLDSIPFQPWARAAYDARQIDQFEPHTRCKASGAARQFSTPYGTEFVEVPELQRFYIMDNGGPNSYRTIYMDGRPHPANLVPTNYGHSVGRWEGDTLVVETVGFNEKFWMDTRGTPHTEKLKFTERFTRIDQNTMQYQATIDDPGAYTAPWTTNMFTMRFNQGPELFEYICQDNNYGDELMVGRSGADDEVDNTRFFIP